MPSPARALLQASPAGRPALAHEMAAPVLFLQAGAASYIRDHHLGVDGGSTLA
jgi:NAD(P)-dependent dehydrogenase (short-subunit alcohol dehydrogenase family)